ncbi:hypothetical protein D3C85_1548760 [compost metagenome]
MHIFHLDVMNVANHISFNLIKNNGFSLIVIDVIGLRNLQVFINKQAYWISSRPLPRS